MQCITTTTRRGKKYSKKTGKVAELFDCSLTDHFEYFEKIWCLYLQGGRSSTVQIVAECFSETPVASNETTRRNIPEDNI
jgi:hypothetical protein